MCIPHKQYHESDVENVLIIEKRHISLLSLICCICCPIQNEDATCDVLWSQTMASTFLVLFHYYIEVAHSHSRKSVHIALTCFCCLPMRFKFVSNGISRRRIYAQRSLISSSQSTSISESRTSTAFILNLSNEMNSSV